jgi:hypothetical protein
MLLLTKTSTSIASLVEELEKRIYSNGDVNYLFMIQSTNVIYSIASLVLGILSLLIVIIVPIVIALELMYICFPAVRAKADELIMKIEGSGHKNNLVQFTLRDAVEAVEEANTRMVGERSALWIYLQIKVKSVLFLMFIVALVVRGSASIIAFMDGLISNIIYAMFG